MPPERSKASKYASEDAHHLVWTVPVEPANVELDGTAFSSNAPINFEDGPPPLVDRDFILFPPNDESPPARKPTHSKKKPDDHIPRPPNAFILFRSSFIKGQHVPTEVETNHSTLSKIIGLTWKNLPNEERLFWHAKAKAALDEHKRKFPQYAFRPAQGKSKISSEKRKVREVGPKDPVRCAKIAELLVEGKKGQELDEAIQEFDKHHIPEIVTRFEMPLTARVYRRSSSAPIPDDDRPERSPKKSRSVSTQPSTPVVPSAPFSEREFGLPEVSMSFNEFSFLAPPSPSFEPNSFSFDKHPAYQAYHSLPELISTSDASVLFHTADNLGTPSDVSIDTSFLGFDDWNCPSPLSSTSCSEPTTPSSYVSPCHDTYGTYILDSLEASLAKSYFSMYENPSDSRFSGAFPETSLTSAFPPYNQDPCKVHVANQDLDFSGFMGFIPEYVL